MESDLEDARSNSPWGGTRERIVWLMSWAEDQIAAGKITCRDVTVQALKTGGARSISDVALMALEMKHFLVDGTWLDELGMPGYARDRCRELFASIGTYRTMCGTG